VGDVVHLAEAFLLEGGVAHRQHFVDDQDLGSEVGATAKGQAHGTSRGVAF